MTDNWWEQDQVVSKAPTSSSDNWWEADSIVGKADTPEQKTEKLSTLEKGARATAYGLLGKAEGAMNTLGKAIGADPQKLAKVNMLINAGREAMGVTPEEYAPASVKASDQNASFGERMSYMPRALIESGAPIAAGAALGGLPGALATVAGTETGPTIDRVRATDKTDPNAELTPSQKARVGGKVGLDMLLTALGGKATLGATAPVRAVGMEGVKQAAGNVVKAGATDALAGGGSAAADKMLVEGEAPSFNDVAVPALTGAALGTSIRAPGATREAAVSVRNRALGDLNPQSRGEVADILARYKGNFDVAGKHLDSELRLATKGLDEVTKDTITKAKLDIEAGKRVNPTDIEAVTKADPEAGRVLQHLDTFSVMKSLDNGGLSGSWLGKALNPFSRPERTDTATDKAASLFGKIADTGLAYHAMFGHVSPEVTAAILGGQATGALALHGIDRLTGAANPAKVITDKFAGTAEPTPSVAQARAEVLAKDVARRQEQAAAASAAEQVAKDEKFVFDIGDIAKSNINDRAKARDLESKRLWREAAASVRAQNKRDDLQANYDAGVLQDVRRQFDLMKNSESASSSDARLALAVSKLKAGLDAQKEAQGPMVPEEQPTFSSLAGTKTGKLLQQAAVTERFNAKQASQARRTKRDVDAVARAKAEQKVLEASSKAKEAKKDADPNMYVFEHLGQKARVDKSLVHSPKRYEESFKRATERRVGLIDEAKSLTDDSTTHKYLDQLATDWTNATNDPAQARKALDRIISDKSIPENVRKHLADNWYRVVGTWETVERNND